MRAAMTSDGRVATPPRTQVPIWKLVRELRDLTRVADLLRNDGPLVTAKLGPERLVPPVVIALDAEGAYQVLSGQQDKFDKHMPVHVETQRLMGLNSFSMDNEAWAPRRRALQPVMNRRHVDGFAHHMQSAAEDAIAGWRTGMTVEVADLGRAIALDVIGRSLFALDLAARRSTVTPALTRTFGRITFRGLAPVRLPNRLRLPRSWRDREVLYDTVNECIDLAVRRRDDAPARLDAGARAEGATGGELVDLLLDTVDPETGKSLDRSAIADELIAFLSAGHDTTATALAASLWLLARHPNSQQRVRDEARSLGDRIGADDLARLPYTRQVLDEAIRLYPPAVGIGRTCMADAEVHGWRIPRGWTVVVSIWSVHHDPAVFPEPYAFDPERFAPGADKDRDRSAYMPFGLGRRACSGAHLAVLEAVIALAVIVRSYGLATQVDALRLTTPFTLNIEPPVPIDVTRID